MSAFVVSKKHIMAIVMFNWRASHDYNESIDTAISKCNLLLKTNIESVNYRYNENETYNDSFTISDLESAPSLSPVEILKLIFCLEYQSCELPNWEETKAYKLLKNIKFEAIYKLSGYEEAKWSI